MCFKWKDSMHINTFINKRQKLPALVELVLKERQRANRKHNKGNLCFLSREWVMGGTWLYNLLLTPSPSSDGHSFQLEFHSGTAFSLCIPLELPDLAISALKRMQLWNHLSKFAKGKTWGAQVSCTLNEIEPLEGGQGWFADIPIPQPSFWAFILEGWILH